MNELKSFLKKNRQFFYGFGLCFVLFGLGWFDVLTVWTGNAVEEIKMALNPPEPTRLEKFKDVVIFWD